MLTLTSDGTAFATGRMRFLDEDPGHPEKSHKLYVKIEPGDFGSPVLAQLDTGSAFSILDREIAEELTLFDGQGQPTNLDTRIGRISGRLERTKITILADEGESTEFEATVFVSRDWPAGSFLGYAGLLERVRFAVDPQQNFFYFGPC
jgi:hypothetical protein